MAWSTRRLADLAGTTVKTIRHYHAIDLLPEPDRAANGYKQYRTAHLVRLLQVRRLRELGMSPAEIREAGDSGEGFFEAVRTLDARLAESIERQQAIRAELAELLTHRSGPDVPAGFESIAGGLTGADRAVISISALLYEEQGMRDLHDIAEHHQEADAAFNALPADADPDAVRAVAARLAPVLRIIYEQHPGTRNPPRPTSAREHGAMQALYQALPDLYNPAQIDALKEAYRLAQDDRVAETVEH